ncbi:MAG: small subunit ribosomal protein S1, partial [Flammeovirgaceae bacterium]
MANFQVESAGDFDWDELSADGFGAEYTKAEKKEMATIYEDTIAEMTERELVIGTIVSLTDLEAVVNIGHKSDGLISLNEFRDLDDVKVGDEVEVYIEKQEDSQGELVLSRKKAKIVKAWENIKNAFENDEVIEGVVKRRTKGGLIVDIFSIEAFLPGSQIDVKPIRDFDVFVGKKMELKVVKINYANDNVVVSHKILIEKDL